MPVIITYLTEYFSKIIYRTNNNILNEESIKCHKEILFLCGFSTATLQTNLTFPSHTFPTSGSLLISCTRIKRKCLHDLQNKQFYFLCMYVYE